MAYSPRMLSACSCKAGIQRDNCPSCEGTGQRIDFKKFHETKLKAFKVVAKSSNTNSFGLYGLVIIAEDGEAFEVGANQLNAKENGAVIYIPVDIKTGGKEWGYVGFEIPRELPKPPQAVIKQVWGNQ